jgi:RimJ/RimL family protein N-acetyltransferase
MVEAVAPFAFETARLRIRPLKDCDAGLYCDLYTDAGTMRFIAPPLSRRAAERSFRASRRLLAETPPRQLVFAIVDLSTRAAIGICSLQQIDLERRTAEAGIMLRPASRSRGYSREGLGALVRHAFERLPIDEVWVQISACYEVVERLVISVGFTRVNDAVRDGSRREMQIWRMHRERR